MDVGSNLALPNICFSGCCGPCGFDSTSWLLDVFDTDLGKTWEMIGTPTRPQLQPDNTCAYEVLMQDTESGTNEEQPALIEAVPTTFDTAEVWAIEKYRVTLDGKVYETTGGPYGCSESTLTLQQDPVSGAYAELQVNGTEERCLDCDPNGTGVLIEITGFLNCTDADDPLGQLPKCTRQFEQFNITETIWANLQPQPGTLVSTYRTSIFRTDTWCDGKSTNLEICVNFSCQYTAPDDPIGLRVDVDFQMTEGTVTTDPCDVQLLSRITIQSGGRETDSGNLGINQGGCFLRREGPFNTPVYETIAGTITATLLRDAPPPTPPGGGEPDQGYVYALPDGCFCCGKEGTLAPSGEIRSLVDPDSFNNAKLFDPAGPLAAEQNGAATRLDTCVVQIPMTNSVTAEVRLDVDGKWKSLPASFSSIQWAELTSPLPTQTGTQSLEGTPPAGNYSMEFDLTPALGDCDYLGGSAAASASVRRRQPTSVVRGNGFGDRFRRAHPAMFKSPGCGGCRDVQRLLNAYGAAGLDEHGERLAGELARLSKVPAEKILAAMKEFADEQTR